MSENDRHIIAYELHQASDMPLSTAPIDRAWMDASHQRAPYRCLPLAIANQAGWFLPSPASFTAIWDGGLFKENVQIIFDPPAGRADPLGLFAPIVVSADTPSTTTHSDQRISSHFGSGIITFSIPYLFRTPRGINLWVKGPSNCFKDGAQPLEGVVETDWLAATFTMNWKLTRPHYCVRFERGEPICMIVPIPRGLAEQMKPMYASLNSNPKLEHDYREWDRSRTTFNAGLAALNPEAMKRGWQRDYMQGRSITGERAKEHQTKLHLLEFARDENAPTPPSS